MTEQCGGHFTCVNI